MSLFPAYGDETDIDIFAKKGASEQEPEVVVKIEEAEVVERKLVVEEERKKRREEETEGESSEDIEESSEDERRRRKRKKRKRSRSRDDKKKKKRKKRKESPSRERRKKSKKTKQGRSPSPATKWVAQLKDPRDFFKESVFISGKPAQLEEWFTIDTRPDFSLRGAPNAYTRQVPRYDKKLCRYLSYGLKKRGPRQLKKGEQEPRYFTPKKKPTFTWTLEISLKKQLLEENEEFVTVPSLESSEATLEPASRRTAYTIINHNDPLGIYDAGTAAYSRGESKVDEESVEDYLSVVTRTELRDKVADLNRAVMDDPRNAEKWLQLVNIQDAVVREDFTLAGTEARSVKANVRTIAEKKRAVLDKALSKLPGSVQLTLEKLELSKTILTTQELTKEWSHLNFRHPTDVSLWKEAIVFSETYLPFFNVKNATKSLEDAFAKLKLIKEGIMVSHEPPPGLGFDLVDLVSWAANLFAATGYFERAIAVFQAAVEYNFFAPENLSKKQVVFEAFWDSRAPRIGEQNARGWAKTLEDSAPCLEDRLRDVNYEDLEDRFANDDESSRAGKWMAIENARAEWQWLPWLADDDEVEDPDRVVGVEHVAPFLVDFPDGEHRFKLLTNFLVFLGARLDRPFYGSRVWLGLIEPNLELLHGTDDPFFDSFPPFRPSPSKSGVGEYQAFIGRVFETGIAFFTGERQRALKHWKLLHSVSMEEPKKVLSQIKGAMKEAENRHDLDLYRLYAARLTYAGRLSEAVKICGTALAVSSENSSLDAGGQVYDVVLKNVKKLNLAMDYVKLLASDLTTANKNTCLQHLVEVAEGCRKFSAAASMVVSDSRLLKATNGFATVQSLLLSAQFGVEGSSSLDVFYVPSLSTLADVFPAWTGCYAWFLYLSSGSASRSSVVLQNALGKLREHVEEEVRLQAGQLQLRRPDVLTCAYMVALEKLHLEYVELMVHLMNRGLETPSAVLRVLMAALEDIPASEPLLSYFFGSKLNPTLQRSLRDYVHKYAPDRIDDPLLVLGAIRMEFERHRRIRDALEEEESQISTNRMRFVGGGYVLLALLEKALSGKKTRHCSFLWRIRMRILFLLGKTSGVKSTFYQAVEQVPFCKSIYMDVVQYQPEMLQEVVDLMNEKQLRVRLPLEELDVLCEPVATDDTDTEPSAGAADDCEME